MPRGEAYYISDRGHTEIVRHINADCVGGASERRFIIGYFVLFGGNLISRNKQKNKMWLLGQVSKQGCGLCYLQICIC